MGGYRGSDWYRDIERFASIIDSGYSSMWPFGFKFSEFNIIDGFWIRVTDSIRPVGAPAGIYGSAELNSHDTKITNNVFIGDPSIGYRRGADGIHLRGGVTNITIANNLIYNVDNGIIIDNENIDFGLKVLNNTISGCFKSGLTFFDNGGNPEIKNNIIAFNPSNTGVNVLNSTPEFASNSITYNNVYGHTIDWGEGYVPNSTNLSVDPLFVNATARDYNIAENSPCVDAGDPLSLLNDRYFPPALGGVRNDLGYTGGDFASGSRFKSAITDVDLRAGVEAAKAVWTNTLESTQNGVLVLRATDAFPNVMPTSGIQYVPGTILGNSTVVFNSSGSAALDSSLIDGQRYYYSLFARHAGFQYAEPINLKTTPGIGVKVLKLSTKSEFQVPQPDTLSLDSDDFYMEEETPTSNVAKPILLRAVDSSGKGSVQVDMAGNLITLFEETSFGTVGNASIYSRIIQLFTPSDDFQNDDYFYGGYEYCAVDFTGVDTGRLGNPKNYNKEWEDGAKFMELFPGLDFGSGGDSRGFSHFTGPPNAEPAKRQLILWGGMEWVPFTLISEPFAMPIYIPRKNQADFLYLSGHGYYQNGGLAGGSLKTSPGKNEKSNALDGKVYPSDVKGGWNKDLDLVIFSLCSVLGIGVPSRSENPNLIPIQKQLNLDGSGTKPSTAMMTILPFNFVQT